MLNNTDSLSYSIKLPINQHHLYSFKGYGVKCHFQQYFSYIVAVSFVGWRKPECLEKTTHLYLLSRPECLEKTTHLYLLSRPECLEKTTHLYLLSSNKHDTNISSLISMCHNVMLFWCRWRHLDKSSINIPPLMCCLKWISHCISHVRLHPWCDIVPRNSLHLTCKASPLMRHCTKKFLTLHQEILSRKKHYIFSYS